MINFDHPNFNDNQHTDTGDTSHEAPPALKGLVPGSIEAKSAWAKIDADAHSPEAVAKGKAIDPKAVGFYMGKPLVPGVGGEQGDFQMLVDKLVYSKGFSLEVAQKIAGRVASKLSGG